MRKWMNLIENALAVNHGAVEELADVRAKLKDLNQKHEELVATVSEPDFDARRDQFIDDYADMWTELADREWELMHIVGEVKSKDHSLVH